MISIRRRPTDLLSVLKDPEIFYIQQTCRKSFFWKAIKIVYIYKGLQMFF